MKGSRLFLLMGLSFSSHSHSHHALPALPYAFCCRPAEVVAPELIGCKLVKRQTGGSLLWGVVVETEAYSQDDPATASAAAPPATKRSLVSQGGFTSM
jgi:3-methyladenine DNA glycosylase Mpg